ncbi:hypothetical protein LIER_11020 [Lithospermum erythrorhizon]|uniref:Uncharacterized protein n=1 Tax=Lithospermum erythrorhizon TaxID=34254 RepID=A0AAV3PLE4_LITER
MIQSESKKEAWIDELPVVLWSLRTTPSHAIGETPFQPCFSEAVLLAEAGLPTYRQLGCILGTGTYDLERMNGEAITRTWHAYNLEKYYA